jgi:hypothetical protein
VEWKIALLFRQLDLHSCFKLSSPPCSECVCAPGSVSWLEAFSGFVPVWVSGKSARHDEDKAGKFVSANLDIGASRRFYSCDLRISPVKEFFFSTLHSPLTSSRLKKRGEKKVKQKAEKKAKETFLVLHPFS